MFVAWNRDSNGIHNYCVPVYIKQYVAALSFIEMHMHEYNRQVSNFGEFCCHINSLT